MQPLALNTALASQPLARKSAVPSAPLAPKHEQPNVFAVKNNVVVSPPPGSSNGPVREAGTQERLGIAATGVEQRAGIRETGNRLASLKQSEAANSVLESPQQEFSNELGLQHLASNRELESCNRSRNSPH